MNIQQISYDECIVLWQLLWADRVSPIEPTSAMMLPNNDCHRLYSNEVGTPTFLGAFENGVLVGVNSLHPVSDTIRSRGLYVVGEYRGLKIGQKLLEKTIEMGDGKLVWSFPKQEALNTYLRSGFSVASPMVHDVIENKWNCYVRT